MECIKDILDEISKINSKQCFHYKNILVCILFVNVKTQLKFKNVLYSVSLWKSQKRWKNNKLTNFQITHNALVLFPQPRYLKNTDDTEF